MDVDKQILDIMKRYSIQSAELEEQLLAKCIQEAILAGDFIRYCTTPVIRNQAEFGGLPYEITSSYSVAYVYDPYREKLRLEERIKYLEDKLEYINNLPTYDFED